MKQLARVFKRPNVSLTTIAAFPAADNRLMLALDAIDDSSEEFQASCILEIELSKALAVTVVYESDVSAADYLYEDGWHGLLLRNGVVELQDGNATITPFKGKADACLSSIARLGKTTLVCGTGDDGIDGFVAKVDKKRLTVIGRTSKDYEPNPLEVLRVGKHAYAGGNWGALLVGDASGFKSVKLPATTFAISPNDPRMRHPVLALHEKSDGSVMIGCRDMAALYAHGKATRLTGMDDGMHVYAVAEYRGDEYWGVESRDRIVLFGRSGTKLTPKLKAKFKPIHYRRLPHAHVRINVREDRMAVTTIDRVHLFDGKAWSQLKVSPDVNQLVKRLSNAMLKR